MRRTRPSMMPLVLTPTIDLLLLTMGRLALATLYSIVKTSIIVLLLHKTVLI